MDVSQLPGALVDARLILGAVCSVSLDACLSCVVSSVIYYKAGYLDPATVVSKAGPCPVAGHHLLPQAWSWNVVSILPRQS